ncbi:hypothetical protein BDR07DRAFT_1432106 [Suillus spraguei]|nr:hypothetical protein BDR07DRAFT_1432106 [Suillus spraguei]
MIRCPQRRYTTPRTPWVWPRILWRGAIAGVCCFLLIAEDMFSIRDFELEQTISY